MWTKLCIDIFHQTNVQKRVSFAQEEGETRLAVASPQQINQFKVCSLETRSPRSPSSLILAVASHWQLFCCTYFVIMSSCNLIARYIAKIQPWISYDNICVSHQFNSTSPFENINSNLLILWLIKLCPYFFLILFKQ